MARSLQDIISELGSVYDPQVSSLRQRQELIPGQVKTEEEGLQARQSQAFDTILSGARGRGLGFSGIPLSEQARYTSTEFLPALARLRQSASERAMSLEDAILGIQERRNTLGQQIYQQEQDREEQRRQFNEQLAAQQRSLNANRFTPTLGGGGSSTVKSATATQRSDKGFDFTDANGQPISAATYAAAKNISFRSLLQTMANAGDAGAKQALNFVGDDYGYDPNKVRSKSLADIYNSLVWGTGRSASPNLPANYGTGYLIRKPQTFSSSLGMPNLGIAR